MTGRRHPTVRWRDLLDGAVRQIALIGGLTGLLYLLVYHLQRAILLNGFELTVAGLTHRGAPANGMRLTLDLLGYFGATLVQFGLYAWLIQLCRQGRINGMARYLALGFPVLFNLGLLFGRPMMSFDLLSYLAHGYIGAAPGGNPYLSHSVAALQTAAAQDLVAFGWRPVHGITPYGALWTQVEIAIARIAPDVTTALLLMKTVVVAASLGSGLVIWHILGRVRPSDQLLGTLVYLWNPVILVEFAAEGHNDAPMILLALLSLLWCTRGRQATAVFWLMLGALTKYIPLVLLPAQLIYTWHRHRDWRQVALQLGAGLFVAAGIGALLYWPLWAGPATFTGVSERVGGQVAGLVRAGIFGVGALLLSLKARDGNDLLRVSAAITLLYVLIGAPDYYPWYATMAIALIALAPHGSLHWAAFALAVCARLVAPANALAVNGWTSFTTETLLRSIVGVSIPLVICVLLLRHEYGRNRRIKRCGRTAPLEA